MPRRLSADGATYDVSLSDGADIRRYSGIGALIAGQIEIDPASGLGTQDVDGITFAARDRERLALRLRLKPGFVSALAKIERTNELIAEVESLGANLSLDELDRLLSPLQNFEFNIDQAQSGQDLVTQLYEQGDLYERAPIVESIEAELGDADMATTPAVLSFYHDLPKLVSDFCRQMRITASVVETGGAPRIAGLYENGEFKDLTFGVDASGESQAMLSANKAELQVYDISVNNPAHPGEDRTIQDASQLFVAYPQNGSLAASGSKFTYSLRYRADFGGINPVNGPATSFQIGDEMDAVGRSASEYAAADSIAIAKSTVTAVIQKNLRGDYTAPLLDDSGTKILGPS